MISTIYLDLDDVLVDFDRAVCRLFHLHYEKTMEVRDGNWGVDDWGVGISHKDLKQKIDNEGEKFWIELEKHEWFGEVIEACLESAKTVEIVTCPGNFSSSIRGKAEWYEQNVEGKYPITMAITSSKAELSKPGTFLIDDREDSCIAFNKAGEGKAVLFPSFGNYKNLTRKSFLENGKYYVREWVKSSIAITEEML